MNDNTGYLYNGTDHKISHSLLLITNYRFQQRQYYFSLMKEILLSRQQLLETAFNQPPGTLPKMERIPNHSAPRSSPSEQRTKRRYFQELAAIRQEVGESDHSSEDENYPGVT